LYGAHGEHLEHAFEVCLGFVGFAGKLEANGSRKTGLGRKLERQPMCQPMVDLETADVNMVEATQAFRKVLSDAIEDGAIKVLEIMEKNENNVDLCYLQQLDRNVAEELWKLDLPHLNKIKKIVLAQNHKGKLHKYIIVKQIV